MAESESVSDVERWILEQIEERTEPDPESRQVNGTIWAVEKRIYLDAEKPRTPYSRDAVETAMRSLESSQRILWWHGSVTLGTEEYLRALVQSEANSDVPRKILVAKANQMLGGE